MRRRLAVLGVTMILLTSCGGDDDSAGSSESAPSGGTAANVEPTDRSPDDTSGDAAEQPSLDTCALLTADEIESTLGVAAPGVPEDYPPSFFGCRWETDDLSNISLSVLVYADAEEAADSFDSTVEMNGYALVDGLGDRAYDTAPLRGLTAQRGRYEASLSVFVSDDDDQAMLDLLEAVVERLDQ